MGLLDFLIDWDIQTIILAAVLVTALAIAGSYGIAVVWRKWKEGKRARAARERRLGTAQASPPKQPSRVARLRSLRPHRK